MPAVRPRRAGCGQPELHFYEVQVKVRIPTQSKISERSSDVFAPADLQMIFQLRRSADLPGPLSR